MDLTFYVSIINIDTYGSRAILAQYKLTHHVKMQFNKIPTTSYVNATRDGGMISQGIGKEIIQTVEPIVLSQMSMREPMKLLTNLFVLCSQSFISSINWLT